MRPYIITLLHGTWGTNSPFTKPNSPLRLHLRNSLGSSIGFLPFKWNGNNSNSSRIAAGRELTLFLKKAFQKYPEYVHVLICHSHGGNVARLALRDPEVRRIVRGVVCVGTPFLDCPKTSFEHVERLIGRVATLVEVGHRYLYNVIGLVSLSFFGFLVLFDRFDYAFASWLLTWVAAGLLVYFLVHGLAKAERQMRAMECDSRSGPRLLCLRMYTDEPGLLLRFLSAVVNGPYTLWNRFLVPMLNIGLAVSIGIGLIAGVLGIAGRLLRIASVFDIGGDVFIFCLIAAAALFMMDVLCAWLVGFMANLAAAHPLGFGKEGWRFGWFVRVRASVEPLDPTAEIQKYRFQDVRKQVGDRAFFRYFNHSVLFIYPTALDAITDFLKRCGQP